MRAPALVFGQTRPSREGLAYRSDAGATPSAFGADIGKGLGDVGASLVDYAVVYEQQARKVERFGALLGESNLRTAMSTKLDELKRNQVPGTTNFPAQANEALDRMGQDFLAKLPRGLQPEFKVKFTEAKNGFLRDALAFQYTSNDAFYRVGIGTEYVKAQKGIAAAPAEYDKWHAHAMAQVDASDLEEWEKIKLKGDIDSGLQAVRFGQEVEQAVRQPTATGTTPANVQGVYSGLVHRGLPQMQAAVMAGNVEQESGGNPQSFNQGENAIGIMQWRLDRQQKLRAFASNDPAGRSVNDIDLQLDFMIAEGERLGSPEERADWARFMAATTPEAANAALKDFIGYGDESAGTRLANAQRIMGVAPTPLTSAAVTELYTDPRFAAVPLDKMLAMQADAQARVAAASAAATAEATQAYQSSLNTLFVGLHDGRAGQTELSVFRGNHPEMDIDDIEKAEKIIADRNALVEAQQRFDGILANNGQGYSTTTDGDDFNKWFAGLSGPQRVTAGDQAFLNGAILPAIQKTQDVPTDLVGLLTAMTRQRDFGRSSFAYDTLAEIERIAPAAFAARTDETLAKNVDFWRARRSIMSPEQLQEAMNPGLSVAHRQSVVALRQEAEALLKSSKNNVPYVTTLMSGILSHFDTVGYGTADPTLSKLPWVAEGMRTEAITRFIDTYPLYGNEAETADAVQKQLERVWGTTLIGGTETTMRLPPEKAGYQPVNGSMEWIDVQVRTELGLPEEQKFELISDAQTSHELAALQSDPQAPMPSYMVATYKDGVFSLVQTPDGTPIRKNFDASALRTGAQEQSFLMQQRTNLEAALRLAENRLAAAQRIAAANQTPLPPGMQEDVDKLGEAVKQLPLKPSYAEYLTSKRKPPSAWLTKSIPGMISEAYDAWLAREKRARGIE